jgi:hypothetical protein
MVLEDHVGIPWIYTTLVFYGMFKPIQTSETRSSMTLTSCRRNERLRDLARRLSLNRKPLCAGGCELRFVCPTCCIFSRIDEPISDQAHSLEHSYLRRLTTAARDCSLVTVSLIRKRT